MGTHVVRIIRRKNKNETALWRSWEREGATNIRFNAERQPATRVGQVRFAYRG